MSETKNVTAEVEETKTEATEVEVTAEAAEAAVEQAEPQAEDVTQTEEAKKPETTIKDVGKAVVSLGKTLWSWKPVRVVAKGAGIVVGTVAVTLAGKEVLKALAEDKAANDLIESGGIAGNIEERSSCSDDEPTYVEATAEEVTEE